MIIGITGYGGQTSKLQRMYIEQSNFTQIECDGLRRLCNIDLNKTLDVGTDIGLFYIKDMKVRKLADMICKNYQYDIVSKALSKINYPESPLFLSGLIKLESIESIDKLKDSFHVTKIYIAGKKKISNYYFLGIDFKSDDITFNNTKYLLQTKVLVKDDPFEFKIVDVNFDIL